MANVVGFFKKAAPWMFAAASTLLPGPLATVAGHLSEVLGKPVGADPEAMAAAVAGATPEQLAAIQERDNQFKLDYQKAGYTALTDFDELTLKDRDSARNRDIQIRDKTPGRLGWFAVVALMLAIVLFGFLTFTNRPVNQAAMAVLSMLIGTLTKIVADVYGFYFGSSAGSEAKNAIIANLSAAPGK